MIGLLKQNGILKKFASNLFRKCQISIYLSAASNFSEHVLCWKSKKACQMVRQSIWK